jgi:hypothetical protein
MTYRNWFATLLLVAATASPAAARQKGGEDEPGPYDVVENWLKPVQPGWIVYAAKGAGPGQFDLPWLGSHSVGFFDSMSLQEEPR